MSDVPLGFKAHITLGLEHKVEALGAEFRFKDYGWSYSQIDGDPVLGPGGRCYLTAHARNYTGLFHQLQEVAKHLRGQGAEPQRLKIEAIVYDTKASHD